MSTAIWSKSERGWTVLDSTGYPNEAALHSLVEEAPELLPLAGSPRVVILGREVRIGSGYADLLAVEASGRLVIIEVKLASNPEARRAVVAQILTYAAFLRGTDRAVLEEDMLGAALLMAGAKSIAELVAAALQDAAFDSMAFVNGLNLSLESGSFRLVLVLDQAPAELIRLVGYLESVTESLTIDLITVSAFDVNGTQILVPQRADPEREPTAGMIAPSANRGSGRTYFSRDGGHDFEVSIQSLEQSKRAGPARLLEWARKLESDGLAVLWGYHGPQHFTLLPYPIRHDAGLVTVVSDGSLWLWRSVFEKLAPGSISEVEALIGRPLGKGTAAKQPSEQLLAALRKAYADAAATVDRVTASASPADSQ